MRSVTRNPPMTFIVARITARAPKNRLCDPRAKAVAINAPETVTPYKAFIPDIKGVCKRLGTSLMTL